MEKPVVSETAADLPATAKQPKPPSGFWDKVRGTLGRVPFMEDALAAYYCATDNATPRHVQAALIGALVYFVAPIDVIPDVVVGLGYVDDAAVLAGVIASVRKYLTPVHYAKARAWLKRES
ncbi:MAG: DUF1232 domain-containing protein [Alphaproteobacteria bacterium]|jgi:uncharacterized membrane protein YkvA (DUF1232 family)|nr:DUF1232 domain-containing protein [Alphaproteobacteria bacterium]